MRAAEPGVWASSKDMLRLPPTVHHSSLEIQSNLLWVKKALRIEKFIVPWFAVSIHLLGKSHQSAPQPTNKLITS